MKIVSDIAEGETAPTASVPPGTSPSDPVLIFERAGGSLRVYVESFRNGPVLINVRRCFTAPDSGEIFPTAKGASLHVEEFDAIVEHADEIRRAFDLAVASQSPRGKRRGQPRHVVDLDAH
jgi:hypothetical protein